MLSRVPLGRGVPQLVTVPVRSPVPAPMGSGLSSALPGPGSLVMVQVASTVSQATRSDVGSLSGVGVGS